MNFGTVARCRARVEEHDGPPRKLLAGQTGDPRWRIWRHPASSFLPSQKPPPAKFCSIVFHTTALLALPARNGMGMRLAVLLTFAQRRRTRSGSKSRTRNKSRLRRSGTLRLLSRQLNRRCETNSQTFSCDENGATEPEAMPSGVPISGISGVDVGPMSGCSTRVAISIAVKSRALARKKGAPGK